MYQNFKGNHYKKRNRLGFLTGKRVMNMKEKYYQFN